MKEMPYPRVLRGGVGRALGKGGRAPGPGASLTLNVGEGGIGWKPLACLLSVSCLRMFPQSLRSLLACAIREVLHLL